jgi:hypothetical protein
VSLLARPLHRTRLRSLLPLLAFAGAATGSLDAEEPRWQLTPNLARCAADAVFVSADIENFLAAQEAILGGGDPITTLQQLYLGRGSAGLQLFAEKYDLTAERLWRAMQAHPEAYARLPETLTALRSHEPQLRSAYSRLQQHVPDAVFPPTYFVVEAHRGIGSGSVEGPLVSVEKQTAQTIAAELAAHLAHEMTHEQQLALQGRRYFEIFGGERRTLLALSIREGTATFLEQLVAGGGSHKNLAREYLLANEQALWQAFERDMLGGETGDWLWRKPADPAWPQDLGYAIGARIVETFFERTSCSACGSKTGS